MDTTQVILMAVVAGVAISIIRSVLNKRREERELNGYDVYNRKEENTETYSGTTEVVTEREEEREEAEEEVREEEREEAREEVKTVSQVFTRSAPNKTCAKPEMVDLGLSVKWASFNLGATKPEEYGQYFRWGETEPFTAEEDKGPQAYKWLRITADGKKHLSKYVVEFTNDDIHDDFHDDKLTLEPADDAAQRHLGGRWRIPTKEEWLELRTKCKWEWVKDKEKDWSGYIKVTSKTNGRFIILPCAGYIDEGEMFDEEFDGWYWTANVSDCAADEATVLNFYENVISEYGKDEPGPGNEYDESRWRGMSIRPVCD